MPVYLYLYHGLRLNALDRLLFHLRQMIDGNYLPIEDAARLLGTSPTSVRDLLDGKLRPSKELVAEIEALSKSYLADPKGRFARGLAARARDGRKSRGKVKIFPIERRRPPPA